MEDQWSRWRSRVRRKVEEGIGGAVEDQWRNRGSRGGEQVEEQVAEGSGGAVEEGSGGAGGGAIEHVEEQVEQGSRGGKCRSRWRREVEEPLEEQ